MLSRPPVAPRGSNTLPAGSSLSGYCSRDEPPAAARMSSSVEDDIDRRPPCPLPPEAINPVNPILATDNFKKTSGWFTPSAQQVQCSTCVTLTLLLTMNILLYVQRLFGFYWAL